KQRVRFNLSFINYNYLSYVIDGLWELPVVAREYCNTCFPSEDAVIVAVNFASSLFIGLTLVAVNSFAHFRKSIHWFESCVLESTTLSAIYKTALRRTCCGMLCFCKISGAMPIA